MPKDVVWYDENGRPAELRSYHFENENDEQGWYYYDGEPFLTKTALKKELRIKDVQLEKIIADENVRREIVENQYRTFTVYNLEDAKESISKSVF